MIDRTKLEHILEYARQQKHTGQHCKIPLGDMVEIMEIAMRKAGNSPITPGRLPGGFTIEEAKELHEDLVRSHISKALSGEKMKKKDLDADLRWIHGVIVQAAWFVKASLEQNALSGNSPATPAGWIRCSERMPPVGVDVQLFVSSTGEQFTGFNLDNTGDFQYAQCFGTPIVCEATHWMPLPEPPKEVRQ